jgi:hypothetical protein
MLIILVGVGYSFLIFRDTKKSTQSSQNIPSPQASSNKVLVSNNMVKLPVPINNPDVFRAAISYSFVGTVESLENNTVTLKNLSEIPPFVLENTDLTKTYFYWWDNANKTSAIATQDDVKIGDTLRVNAFYSLKQNRWTTHQVFIYTDTIPETATPAAFSD